MDYSNLRRDALREVLSKYIGMPNTNETHTNETRQMIMEDILEKSMWTTWEVTVSSEDGEND